MTTSGKRKAKQPSKSEDDANEIFRRHFEAQFEPLTASKRAKDNTTSDKDDEKHEDGGLKQNAQAGEEENEWGGLSENDNDDEEDGYDEDLYEGMTTFRNWCETSNANCIIPDGSNSVEVVDHSISQPSKAATMSKRELKAFMVRLDPKKIILFSRQSNKPQSSKVPDQTDSSDVVSTPNSSSSSKPGMAEDAPSLLKNDLELRRLISESHLLNPTASTSIHAATNTTAEPKAFASGRIRAKTTDLRVQALGSKLSIHKQEKMPMNMRKGITAAATGREVKRRREAKENGVILERQSGGVKKRKKREGGLGGPGVGRLRGAELKISEGDVRKIEGGRDVFGRRNKSWR